METMKQRAKYALPLVAIIAISCLMALMFYPMMNAQLRQLPVAVLSLDEGATTAQGEVNVGETMVKKLTDAASASDADEQPMVWTKVSSQDELDKAFADHDYYAAITIPKDFTSKQMAVKQAAAKAQIESATALAQAMAKTQAEAAAQGLTGEAAQQYVQAAMQKAIAAQSGAGETDVASGETGFASAASGSSASSDDGNAPAVTLTIDNSKSPMVAQPAQTERAGHVRRRRIPAAWQARPRLTIRQGRLVRPRGPAWCHGIHDGAGTAKRRRRAALTSSA